MFAYKVGTAGAIGFINPHAKTRHVMAAKAVAFKEANTPSFKIYAQKIVANAQDLAEEFLKKGIRLVTGGTENHLMILDVSRFNITGRQAETALRAASITVSPAGNSISKAPDAWKNCSAGSAAKRLMEPFGAYARPSEPVR